MNRIACLFFLILLTACAANPLPKTLELEHPPRLGIIGFKITAPIKHISSIIEHPPKGIKKEDEAALISETLRGIEERAAGLLVTDLNDEKKVVPIVIPDGIFGTHRGERPAPGQIDLLKKEFGLDAVLYGDIPWYGKTRLIYPVLGETLDIAAETLILGFATSWNAPVVLGNIGLELLTSTPIWFGGAYIFGLAFRPVTVETWVLSADGREIWHKSVDRTVSRKILKGYPEPERSKKEVQLDASLQGAMKRVAKSLSE